MGKTIQLPNCFKQAAAVVTALFALILCACLICTPASAADEGFHVSGTQILDANDNVFEMRGVNVAHAWYTGYTELSIKAAANLGANTVRVVLADGGKWNKTTYSEVEKIVSCCKENKVVCVLEVHDATGSDSTADLNKAVDYWKELKDLLNQNTEYVIVNIANEWCGSWDANNWANGYKSAVKALRDAGINNMLMVDCAGWGQYPDSIKYRGEEVAAADSHKNTVFSIHMYEYSGGDANTVKTNIDNALAVGAPLVIGEFGHRHSNGDVDEKTIMSYCEQKGVGYLGWSWKGNSGGVEYLDLANSWDGSSLSEWGEILFNGDNGIKKTSSVCSVFTGKQPSGNDFSGETVTGFTLGGRASTALRLNWNKNTTADGYIIEKYDGAKWVRIAKIANNATTTYRVTGLSAGTAYKFRMKAYKMNGSTALYSAYTSTLSARTNPSDITGLKLGGRASNALRLNWNKNTSASGYIIEQYKSGKWVRIAKIAGNATTTYRVSGLSAGTAYKFRMKAYKMSGSTALYSGYTATLAARTNPSNVTGVKIGGKASNALRLNWTKNTSADGYIVEFYKGGKWVRAAKITNNATVTYRISGLAKNTTYKIRIKAYKMSGTTALYSGYTTISGKTTA